MEQNNPHQSESDTREPTLVGDIIPGVLEGIKRREELAELLDKQQELYGSSDQADQERLQEVQTRIRDLSEDFTDDLYN